MFERKLPQSNIFGAAKKKTQEEENLLPYLQKVVVELANLTDGISFKGGVINLNLITNGGYTYSRVTKDIDMNSNIEVPMLQELLKVASERVFNAPVEVVVKRDKEDGARFVVNVEDESKINFKIDVNKLKFDKNKVTTLEIDDSAILVQTVVMTLIDKLSVVNSPRVCNRVKDLTDLYAFLNTDLEIILSELKDEISNRNLDLTVCDTLINLEDVSKQGLQHAFNKFDEVEGLPKLEQLVNVVVKFIDGLNSLTGHDYIWDSQSMEWKEW